MASTWRHVSLAPLGAPPLLTTPNIGFILLGRMCRQGFHCSPCEGTGGDVRYVHVDARFIRAFVFFFFLF